MGFTWDIQKRITKYTLMAMAVVAVLATLCSQNPRPFILALVFGTFISILNFRNLALTLEKAVTMYPGSAQVYASSNYIIRFLINGIVVFVSIKADYLNVLGAVTGLFLIKIVIIITSLFNNKKSTVRRNLNGKEEE